MDLKVTALIPNRIFTSLQNGYVYGKAVLISGEGVIDVISVDDIPEGIQVETYEGCTLLPGLIDVHVHIEDWVAPVLLSYGITTARDTGNELN